jgi:hypothetical protein
MGVQMEEMLVERNWDLCMVAPELERLFSTLA